MYFGVAALLTTRRSTRSPLFHVLSIATLGAGLLTAIEYAIPALQYNLDPANEVDGNWLKYQLAIVFLRVIVFATVVSIGTGCAMAVRAAAERLVCASSP